MFLHDILLFLVVEISVMVFWAMAQCISYVSSSTTLVTTPKLHSVVTWKMCIIKH